MEASKTGLIYNKYPNNNKTIYRSLQFTVGLLWWAGVFDNLARVVTGSETRTVNLNIWDVYSVSIYNKFVYILFSHSTIHSLPPSNHFQPAPTYLFLPLTPIPFPTSIIPSPLFIHPIPNPIIKASISNQIPSTDPSIPFTKDL